MPAPDPRETEDTEPVDEIVTLTIRTDDMWATAEHVKHLLEAEGYDVDVTHG